MHQYYENNDDDRDIEDIIDFLNTYGLVDTEHEWMEQAACKGHGDSWFKQSSKHLAVCHTCPVRERCLEYALNNDIDYYVYGGVTAEDRKKMKRERAA